MLLEEGLNHSGVLIHIQGDELNVGAILVLIDKFL
jgi:hypothetical protein